MESAYQYFGHRKFRMRPKRCAESWFLAGIAHPRKIRLKKKRREWMKKPICEKVDASNPRSTWL
eukprot:5711985-Amphidinium_carterae.1